MREEQAMKSTNLFRYLTISVAAFILVVVFPGGGTSTARAETKRLVVTVEVFSGRPNPTYEITDPGEIELLREQLRNLPGLPEAEANAAAFSRLGYRGIVIINAAGIAGIPGMVQILAGKVKVFAGGGTEENQFFVDAEGMEKHYLALAIDQGIIPEEMLVRGLVPDPAQM
jgi:hypothetical protein